MIAQNYLKITLLSDFQSLWSYDKLIKVLCGWIFLLLFSIRFQCESAKEQEWIEVCVSHYCGAMIPLSSCQSVHQSPWLNFTSFPTLLNWQEQWSNSTIILIFLNMTFCVGNFISYSVWDTFYSGHLHGSSYIFVLLWTLRVAIWKL